MGAGQLAEADLVRTWKSYKATGNRETRNLLVVHYTSLVRYVANKVASGLPSMVERDDLISYGQFGLIEAMENFDPARGVKFETFAVARIRGSIIDELRKLDWVPRSVRSKAKDVEKAQNELQIKLGRPAEESELAEHLGIDVRELWAVQSQSSSNWVGTLDEHDDDDRQSVSDVRFDIASNPEDLFEAAEVINLMAEAVNTMPERCKTILVLYYLQEMTLAEIGEILGVTESRVCQLQSKVLQTLREALGSSGVLAA